MPGSTIAAGGPRQRRPDLESVFTINPDGSRNFLHLADVRGRWQVRRRIVYWILIAVYVALPLIRVGGHPAIHIDLGGRAAYLFGQTFTNQDFYLVFFLVSGLGFGLFVLTALFGRVWCGYACPQTVFLEAVYRRVERLVEGPRQVRLRRDTGPQTAGRVARKVIKHAAYLAISFAVAHVFLAYFIPWDTLLRVMRSGPSGHEVAFGWTMFWTGLLYFDYSWFREQTCLIVCPYGRLQSALTDQDSIIIGYDARRGEPRSKKTESGGDCIDCYRCVTVCPTGIDIRRGLQMECIGCANCIDACDEVMDKIGRPRGLVRYDSQRGFAEGKRRGLVRGRVVLYGVLMLAGLGVFGFAAAGRTTFEVHVLRPQGMPFEIAPDAIRNLYTLRIQNKGRPTTYRIRPVETRAPDGAPIHFIIPQEEISLGTLEDRRIPVFAVQSRGDYRQPFPFRLAVVDEATGDERAVQVRFRGP